MRRHSLLLIVGLIGLVFLAPNASTAKVTPHEQYGIRASSGGENLRFGFNGPFTYTKIIDGIDATIRQVGVRPQGDMIIYSVSYDSSGTTKREIVMANADGTSPVIISAGYSGHGGIYGYMNPMWSKDGSKAAWLKVFNSAPNKIEIYDYATGARSFGYEPVAPLDAANFDFLGNSNSDFIFWDWNAGTGEADLITVIGGVRTNITNSPTYSEYEPNSDMTGTTILYWSGEMTAEPCDTVHLLTYTGGSWQKDIGFIPIVNAYWAFWAYAGYGPQDLRVCLTSYSAGTGCTNANDGDIEVWTSDGSRMVIDVTGTYYPGGKWNFFGCNPVNRDGSIYFTSNDENPSPGRDAFRAVPTTLVGVSPPDVLNKCDDASRTLSVDITNVPPMRGYEIWVEIDESKFALPNTLPYGFAEGPFLDAVGNATFQVYKHAEGLYEVAGAILGPTGGASGSGTLFTITGDPVGETAVSTSIDLYDLKVRDPDNVPIFANPADGTMKIDCTDPCVTSVNSGQICWTSAPTVTINGNEGPLFGVVKKLYYQYKVYPNGCADGDWLFLASVTLAAPTWSTTGTPGSPPPGPGKYTLFVMAEDEAGNQGLCACAGGFVFNYNPNVPTVDVTGLSVSPGHRDITVTWTNPVLTGGEEVVIIRKATAGNYPQYLTNTAYPTNLSDGTEVYRGTGTSVVDTWGGGTGDQDISERNIHLYRAFVTSCGGTRASPGRANLRDDFVTENATDATDATVNYWLGDLTKIGGFGSTKDGYVSALDLSDFSGQFGLTPPGNAEADFGPTVMPPLGVRGVPNPDSKVDFEDLILLAINYNNVAPLQGEQPTLIALGHPGSGPVRLETGPILARVRAGQSLQVPVVLRGDASRVQGIRTVIDYDASLLGYESSEVSQAIGQAEHFFKDLPSAGKVDLNLALLGGGAALQAEGVVFTVRFRALRDGQAVVNLRESKVRDTENRELLGVPGVIVERAQERGEVVVLPTAFRLGDARPNPFNPRTAIYFDLPRASEVRLVIYDAAGQLVRTLVDGSWPAGSHAVEWDGRDAVGRPAGSGIYFYAMRAGSYQSQRRMTLLK